MGRPHSVIAQGSTPAPIDHVVNDDKTECSKSRKSLGLSSITRRDGIAKCMKQNTQNKENIKNAILLESSPLRPRTVIAQRSTPAPTDNVDNDDDAERSGSGKSLGLSAGGISKRMRLNPSNESNQIAQGSTPASIDDVKHEQLKLNIQNDINMDNDRKKRYLNIITKHESRMKTLNDNSDKINHKHAKNMIIDYVNDDCLAEIFMYVPACERLKIAKVCRKWKRALEYSWFNVKKLELIYWRFRQLQNFVIYHFTDEKFTFFESLFKKCGRYLTILDLSYYSIDIEDPVLMINNYCPNLVKLRLRFCYIKNRWFRNVFRYLSQLKSLTMIFEEMKGQTIPPTLIDSLKNVAGTLTELYLLHFVQHLDECCDYPNICAVIRRLKALKRFEVAGIRGFNSSSKYLKNNEKSFYFNHNQYVKKLPDLGYSVVEITKLDLTSCFIKDNTLYVIANTIISLEILTIPCEQITDEGVVALSKMSNLQTLYLKGHNNVIDSSLKLLKNIVKLSLPRSNKITDVSVTKLVENSPKIHKLLLHYTTSVTANFVKKAAKISSQRKQLLKISIHSLIPNVKRYESPYFKICIIKNKEK